MIPKSATVPASLTVSSAAGGTPTMNVPPADKYSALAELDGLFSTNTNGGGSQLNSSWSGNTFGKAFLLYDRYGGEKR